MLQLSDYASVVTSPSDHSQGKFSAFNDLCVYTKDSESKSEFTQSCLTLCDRMDCSLLGCSVHGILRARILKWVASVFDLSPDLKKNHIKYSSLNVKWYMIFELAKC